MGWKGNLYLTWIGWCQGFFHCSLHPGTWEYTPGKGKTSSKPSFSVSMLIFGKCWQIYTTNIPYMGSYGIAIAHNLRSCRVPLPVASWQLRTQRTHHGNFLLWIEVVIFFEGKKGVQTSSWNSSIMKNSFIFVLCSIKFNKKQSFKFFTCLTWKNHLEDLQKKTNYWPFFSNHIYIESTVSIW